MKRSVVGSLLGVVLGLGCGAPALAQTPGGLRYLEPVFGTKVTRDLVYGGNANPWTKTNEDLLLDVHEPEGDTESARPALVYVHGGLFWYGSKSGGEAQLNCTHFAARGYVCFAIDYRLATSYEHGGLMPDAMTEDIKAAVRWVRMNAAIWRVDPERIGLVGDSVGGDGVISASQTTWEGNSGSPGWRSDVRCVVEYWGFPHETIGNRKCSMAIVHGTQDPGVPFEMAQQMASEAKALGVPTRFVALQGAGHTPWDRWSTIAPEVIGFLYEVFVLQQRAGITAQPGWSAPGALTLRAGGWEGQTLYWFVGLASPPLPVLNWGTLQLDPASFQLAAQSAFAPGVGASTQSISLLVPGAMHGSLSWQGLYFGGLQPAQPVRLSNLVTTRF